MTALAFVDTETTGVHPGRLVWEVAVIRREPDGTEKVLNVQVHGVDLSEADPFGLKVGGFYDRYLGLSQPAGVRCKPEAEVARLVERATRGAHVVGVVPNFDTEVLDVMLRRHRLIPAWHYHLIDVEALAVGYLSGRAEHEGYTPITLPWKSDELSRACGVEPPSEDERHTALGDARWAMRWYDAIRGSGRSVAANLRRVAEADAPS